MTLTAYLALHAAVVFGALFVLWLVSLRLRDASLVDIFWGFGFVLLAWTGFLIAGQHTPGPRSLLLVALVTAWGLRLTWHLARRNLGHGEDYRYQAMRARHGDRFGLVSLYLVFGLQGALMLLVATPVVWAQAKPGPAALGWLDAVGVGVFAVGLFFETVGDWQLARFKADPASAGRVMDRGLWRYTRHPNYFGDFMVWWGIFLVAAATGHASWTIFAPIVMSVLLLRVSGVALLERELKTRRPGYADYVRRTSAFFPWPPRGDSSKQTEGS